MIYASIPRSISGWRIEHVVCAPIAQLDRAPAFPRCMIRGFRDPDRIFEKLGSGGVPRFLF